jgi:hypothetical protein
MLQEEKYSAKKGVEEGTLDSLLWGCEFMGYGMLGWRVRLGA